MLRRVVDNSVGQVEPRRLRTQVAIARQRLHWEAALTVNGRVLDLWQFLAVHFKVSSVRFGLVPRIQAWVVFLFLAHRREITLVCALSLEARMVQHVSECLIALALRENKPGITVIVLE